MRKLALFGILFLGILAPGYSQIISFGVKAGVPLTDALQGYSTGAGSVSTSTDRWIVGPTVELHLPFRLSFEADALYRRESYVLTGSGPVVTNEWFSYVSSTITKHPLNNWQFPFLGKYDFSGGLFRPFIDGGVTWQHLSGDSFIDNPNTAGVTVGGGLTVKLSFLRLSPEIRYTRWGNNDVYSPFVTRSQNQADVLVGLSF